MAVLDPTSFGIYLQVLDAASLPTGAERFIGKAVHQVDTRQVKIWDGTGWYIMWEPAQSWTPVWTAGLVVGNGKYGAPNPWFHRSDGWCDFGLNLRTGSTTTYSASPPTLTLPVAPLQYGSDIEIEMVDPILFRSYRGQPLTGSGDVAFRVRNASGTYQTEDLVSSTVPFTWASNSTLTISGRYRMNTRYL